VIFTAKSIHGRSFSLITQHKKQDCIACMLGSHIVCVMKKLAVMKKWWKICWLSWEFNTNLP